MNKKLGLSAVMVALLAATTLTAVTPAEAWCRWGRCRGWGWRGPVAAGVVAGAVIGGAAIAAAGPRGYYYPYGAYPYPGGHFVCPPGYHWGQHGDSCYAN